MWLRLEWQTDVHGWAVGPGGQDVDGALPQEVIPGKRSGKHDGTITEIAIKPLMKAKSYTYDNYRPILNLPFQSKILENYVSAPNSPSDRDMTIFC